MVRFGQHDGSKYRPGPTWVRMTSFATRTFTRAS